MTKLTEEQKSSFEKKYWNYLEPKQRIKITLWSVFKTKRCIAFFVEMNKGKGVKLAFTDAEKMTSKEVKESYKEFKSWDTK